MHLDKASTAYGLEINAENTKLMTNNINGISIEIKINGQKLETVTSFKYLGSVITDECSKPEIHSRTAQATAAFKHSLGSKIQPMRSLVTSVFLYAFVPGHGLSQQSSKEEYKPWK